MSSASARATAARAGGLGRPSLVVAPGEITVRSPLAAMMQVAMGRSHRAGAQSITCTPCCWRSCRAASAAPPTPTAVTRVAEPMRAAKVTAALAAGPPATSSLDSETPFRPQRGSEVTRWMTSRVVNPTNTAWGEGISGVSILVGKFGRVPARIDQLAILLQTESSRHQGDDFRHGALLGADDRNPLSEAVDMNAICDLEDVGRVVAYQHDRHALSRIRRIRSRTISDSLTPRAAVGSSTITSLVPNGAAPCIL